MIPEHRDAFGHAIVDYYHGRHMEEAGSFGCRTWFASFDDWFERERKAIPYVNGTVLDIGCAAGRHALHLQESGYEVLGIDNSPLAIEVSHLRGVRSAMTLPVTAVSYRLGQFGTILMLGNNFGLVGNLERGRWLFRRFKRMTSADAVVIAGDGYFALDQIGEVTRKRIESNIAQGRLPGEFVLRPQYRNFVSPPLQWLYATPEHMRTVLKGTGWFLDTVIEDGTGAFVGIIRKNGANT